MDSKDVFNRVYTCVNYVPNDLYPLPVARFEEVAGGATRIVVYEPTPFVKGKNYRVTIAEEE